MIKRFNQFISENIDYIDDFDDVDYDDVDAFVKPANTDTKDDVKNWTKPKPEKTDGTNWIDQINKSHADDIHVVRNNFNSNKETPSTNKNTKTIVSNSEIFSAKRNFAISLAAAVATKGYSDGTTSQSLIEVIDSLPLDVIKKELIDIIDRIPNYCAKKGDNDTKTNVNVKITGYIKNDLLIVTGITAGKLEIGDVLDAGNIKPRTTITGFGNGTGGTGSYKIKPIGQDTEEGPIRILSICKADEQFEKAKNDQLNTILISFASKDETKIKIINAALKMIQEGKALNPIITKNLQGLGFDTDSNKLESILEASLKIMSYSRFTASDPDPKKAAAKAEKAAKDALIKYVIGLSLALNDKMPKPDSPGAGGGFALPKESDELSASEIQRLGSITRQSSKLGINRNITENYTTKCHCATCGDSCDMNTIVNNPDTVCPTCGDNDWQES